MELNDLEENKNPITRKPIHFDEFAAQSKNHITSVLIGCLDC